MRKSYVIDNGESPWYVVNVKGFVPKNQIGLLPEGEDPAWLDNIEVPEMEEQPKQAIDGNGDPVFTTESQQQLDENGEYIVDGNGDPVMEDIQIPAYELDGNGDLVMESVQVGSHMELQINQATKDQVLVDRADAYQQTVRDEKLRSVRAERDKRMKDEVDVACNELILGERSDVAAILAHKTALKAYTNPYKDSQDLNKGLSTLDAVADNLSDLTWPTKP